MTKPKALSVTQLPRCFGSDWGMRSKVFPPPGPLTYWSTVQRNRPHFWCRCIYLFFCYRLALIITVCVYCVRSCNSYCIVLPFVVVCVRMSVRSTQASQRRGIWSKKQSAGVTLPSPHLLRTIPTLFDTLARHTHNYTSVTTW